MSSMLLDLVGRGLAAPGDDEADEDFINLLAGRPELWLVLESDFTLDGEAGGLSSNDFFLVPWNILLLFKFFRY